MVIYALVNSAFPTCKQLQNSSCYTTSKINGVPKFVGHAHMAYGRSTSAPQNWVTSQGRGLLLIDRHLVVIKYGGEYLRNNNLVLLKRVKSLHTGMCKRHVYLAFIVLVDVSADQLTPLQCRYYL